MSTNQTTNKGGRPPVGPAVQIRLPDDILKQIDQYAREGGVSRAAIIRTLLVEALDART
jgi:metal-responsive CopG/Arc/MetJ family transcriptional regulator